MDSNHTGCFGRAKTMTQLALTEKSSSEAHCIPLRPLSQASRRGSTAACAAEPPGRH